jgi:hypothetical protein
MLMSALFWVPTLTNGIGDSSRSIDCTLSIAHPSLQPNGEPEDRLPR